MKINNHRNHLHENKRRNYTVVPCDHVENHPVAWLTGNQGYHILQTDEVATIQFVTRSKIMRRTLVHVHEAHQSSTGSWWYLFSARDSNPTASESVECKLACSADLSHTEVLGNEKHDKGGPAYCYTFPLTHRYACSCCLNRTSSLNMFPQGEYKMSYVSFPRAPGTWFV